MASRIELWWLPLGAGGWFVANNGRLFERFAAWRERRPRADLYHTALVVVLDGERTVIENAWPIPDALGAQRGVVFEGPVFAPALARSSALRYEVRRWRDGIIADAAWAVDSPHLVTAEAATARRVLSAVPEVPRLVWGRRPAGAAEMWNSNSVIAWLLARAGAHLDAIQPPAGGRAPGWECGVQLARQTRAPELVAS